MISLYDGELKDILPIEFTRQPQILALSYALKQEFVRLLAVKQKIYIYASIDTATDDVLDYLAVDLHVRYYNQNYDIEKKRNLIKSAFMVGMMDGTKYAVDSVLQTAFGEGESTEWFDYGGEPGHFRIDLNMDTYEIGDLMEAITTVKRMSAHLDRIALITKAEHNIYFGTILVCTGRVTISCMEPNFNTEDGGDLLDEDGAYLLDENGYYLSE